MEIHILTNKTDGSLLGVFTEEHQILSVCNLLDDEKSQVVESLCRLNTTLVREGRNHTSIKKCVTRITQTQTLAAQQSPSSSTEGDLTSTSTDTGTSVKEIPREMKRQYEKMKEKLAVFKESLGSFRKMVDDGVVDIKSDTPSLPKLFLTKFPWDRYDILLDILRKHVPDENAFDYFMERYQATTEDECTIETINEILCHSSSNSEEEDDSESDDSEGAEDDDEGDSGDDEGGKVE
jgi:hypothetical protein